MVSLERLVRTGAFTLVSLTGCQYSPYEDTGTYLDVVLYPQDPSAEEDLHCRVDMMEYVGGYIGYLQISVMGAFDYFWFVNREKVFTETGVSASTLEDGSVSKGDYVECSVWAPENSSSASYEVGFDTAYVE